MLQQNIELLQNIQYPLTLISDNHRLQEIDDTYDGLHSLNSLEYSIYFTFQESFNNIRKSWDYREQFAILNDLDVILDRLYDLKETKINKITGEETPNLEYDHTDIVRLGDSAFNELFTRLSDQYHHQHDALYRSHCKNVVLRSFNNFCGLLLQSREYLYNHDINLLGLHLKHDIDESSDSSDSEGYEGSAEGSAGGSAEGPAEDSTEDTDTDGSEGSRCISAKSAESAESDESADSSELSDDDDNVTKSDIKVD